MSKNIGRIIGNLRRSHLMQTYYDNGPVEGYFDFVRERGLDELELFWWPEDYYYPKVLDMLKPNDVVFDVGAGDFRFALMASQKVRKVYAVEVNPITVSRALKIIGYSLPRNVIPICANALDIPLPSDVTVVTILMIHRRWPIPEEWKKQARIIFSTFGDVKVLEKVRDND